MKTRRRWSLLGFLLAIPLVLIVMGIIFVAPECQNALQLLSRGLFAVVLVVISIFIKNKAKRTKRNILNK